MDIKYNYETKFLGLHLTEGIKWDINITKLSSKLRYIYLPIIYIKHMYILHQGFVFIAFMLNTMNIQYQD
jgi:hypothetical protein